MTKWPYSFRRPPPYISVDPCARSHSYSSAHLSSGARAHGLSASISSVENVGGRPALASSSKLTGSLLNSGNQLNTVVRIQADTLEVATKSSARSPVHKTSQGCGVAASAVRFRPGNESLPRYYPSSLSVAYPIPTQEAGNKMATPLGLGDDVEARPEISPAAQRVRCVSSVLVWTTARDGRAQHNTINYFSSGECIGNHDVTS
ncbi:hypothetical protein EVAR_103022_1 [Eumeta japonica]|uniref:Uncharacterized protein n=1 Tax=Eumeta variegata TaxID=151549 RepID=A0A4C1WEU6_EUMVA|nr:hypothetical protein EVAR_103022_1 [Eumeta japonica]